MSATNGWPKSLDLRPMRRIWWWLVATPSKWLFNHVQPQISCCLVFKRLCYHVLRVSWWSKNGTTFQRFQGWFLSQISMAIFRKPCFLCPKHAKGRGWRMSKGKPKLRDPRQFGGKGSGFPSANPLTYWTITMEPPLFRLVIFQMRHVKTSIYRGFLS